MTTVIRVETPNGPRWVGSPTNHTTPNPNLAACFDSEQDAQRTAGPWVAAHGAKVCALDIVTEHAAWVARGRPQQ